MAKKKFQPPPPTADHIWREPIKIDYRSIEQNRLMIAIRDRREEMLRKYRENPYTGGTL